MSTGTFTLNTSYTQTNGLQPDRSTPPGTPVWTDSRPTMVVEGELLLGASATAAVLPIPAAWTQVYQVVLMNIDTVNNVNITTFITGSANPQVTSLPPNGGQYCKSYGAVAAETEVPALMTVRAVATTGISPASAATKLYYFITGA